MKKILTTMVSLILLTSLSANNVQITNVSMGVFTVSFDISWDNSWCLGDGTIASDGIWIVIKNAPNGGPSWQHSNITSVTAGSGFEAVISSDNVGFILKRTSSFNGTSSTSLTVGYSPNGGTYRDLKVMATEMVRVVNGVFYVGDGWSDRTLHKGDDATASYYVNHEGVIPVGTGGSEVYGVKKATAGTFQNFTSGMIAISDGGKLIIKP